MIQAVPPNSRNTAGIGFDNWVQTNRPSSTGWQATTLMWSTFKRMIVHTCNSCNFLIATAKASARLCESGPVILAYLQLNSPCCNEWQPGRNGQCLSHSHTRFSFLTIIFKLIHTWQPVCQSYHRQSFEFKRLIIVGRHQQWYSNSISHPRYHLIGAPGEHAVITESQPPAPGSSTMSPCDKTRDKKQRNFSIMGIFPGQISLSLSRRYGMSIGSHKDTQKRVYKNEYVHMWLSNGIPPNSYRYIISNHCWFH